MKSADIQNSGVRDRRLYHELKRNETKEVDIRI